MKRREFITLLGGATAAWPLATRAEQAERLRKVGVLVPAAAGTPHWQAYVAAFREGLQKLGWSDGRNIHIEERWGPNADELGSHAAEFAGMMPDVILAGAASASRPMQQATRTIPIVFAMCPIRWPTVSFQTWRGRAATSPDSPTMNRPLPSSGLSC